MKKVSQDCFSIFWGFLLVIANAKEFDVISSVLKHSCFTTLRTSYSSLTILLVVIFSVAAFTLACSFKTSTSTCVDSTLALSSSFSFSSFATWIVKSCISGSTDSSQLSSLPCISFSFVLHIEQPWSCCSPSLRPSSSV